jgi:hypothetical protein
MLTSNTNAWQTAGGAVCVTGTYDPAKTMLVRSASDSCRAKEAKPILRSMRSWMVLTR